MMKMRDYFLMTKSRGFNLIELLVSLVVVAVSLFAVAKIQITGMQTTHGAKQSTSSTVSTVNLLERLSGHRDGLRTLLDAQTSHNVSYQLKSADQDDKCNTLPTHDEENSDSSKANLAIECEIKAWVFSVHNSLNLVESTDICANVFISDIRDYEYKKNFDYNLPRVIVEYKWRKNPSSSNWGENGSKACVFENNRLNPPVYSSNPSADESADVGFSSMEYLLP